MIEFLGDWFNAQYVTAVEVTDSDVSIHVHDREDSFDYSFDSEDEAKREVAKFTAAIYRMFSKPN